MRRHLLTVLIIYFSTSILAFARLRESPGFEDIQDMARDAPLVFRGQVTDVRLANNANHGSQIKDGLAVISVDRWYRGSSSNKPVEIHFVYDPPAGFDGHDCSNLEIGSYWIIFAKPGRGEVLELFDDCDGALRVSSLLGPETSDGFLSQIEEDFAED
jgi:hypothetical protein